MIKNDEEHREAVYELERLISDPRTAPELISALAAKIEAYEKDRFPIEIQRCPDCCGPILLLELSAPQGVTVRCDCPPERFKIAVRRLLAGHARRGGYNPDSVPPPGASIRDIMDEKVMTDGEARLQLGLSRDGLAALLRGDMWIDTELAEKLSRLLGGSIVFWLSRELNYRRCLIEGGGP